MRSLLFLSVVVTLILFTNCNSTPKKPQIKQEEVIEYAEVLTYDDLTVSLRCRFFRPSYGAVKTQGCGVAMFTRGLFRQTLFLAGTGLLIQSNSMVYLNLPIISLQSNLAPPLLDTS